MNVRASCSINNQPKPGGIMALSITVLRHANALVSQGEGNSTDQARPLSPQGYDQALARRQAFGEMEFHLVISSPVLRAVQTAQRVGDDQPIIIENLSPYQGEVADSLFAKLGYVSLSAYRKEDGGAFDRVAAQAWCNIRESLKVAMGAACVTDIDDFNILVVGHAVTANALGCAILGSRKEFITPGEAAAQDRLSELVLGEACGFTIVFDDDELITLEIHQ